MATATRRHLFVFLVAMVPATTMWAAARTTTFVVQATVPVECEVALDSRVRAVATLCSDAAPCKVEMRRTDGFPGDASEPERSPGRDGAAAAVVVTITF